VFTEAQKSLDIERGNALRLLRGLAPEMTERKNEAVKLDRRTVLAGISAGVAAGGGAASRSNLPVATKRRTAGLAQRGSEGAR